MHCWCRKQAGYRLRTVTVFFFFCGVHSHCITYKRRLSLHRSALSVNLYSKLLLTPNRLSKVICGTPNTRRHDRHHLPEQMSEPPKPPYAPLLSPNTNPSLEHFFRNAQQSNQQEPKQLVGNNSQFSQRSLQEMRQLVIQQQEQQERRSQRAIQDALRLAANVSGQQYSANPVQHQPSQSIDPNRSFSHQSSNTPSANGKPLSTSPYSAAPPPPPGPTLQAPPPPKNTLFPAEALLHLPTRPVSARARLGRNAVLEARKVFLVSLMPHRF